MWTATTVREDEKQTIVRYHQTDIVKFDQEKIILNTGGYNTATTKRRMNQISKMFNLGFHVFQKEFQFYVDYKNEQYTFDQILELKR